MIFWQVQSVKVEKSNSVKHLPPYQPLSNEMRRVDYSRRRNDKKKCNKQRQEQLRRRRARRGEMIVDVEGRVKWERVESWRKIMNPRTQPFRKRWRKWSPDRQPFLVHETISRWSTLKKLIQGFASSLLSLGQKKMYKAEGGRGDVSASAIWYA